eukprot:TRINITY_DN18722_c0_g1_i2.p1 TRINITY_DN18722_c0_g1~~TRINITY_DN18722_c0_g1_i2.p1  ORF type:complete len:207 (-),score=81.41 TRINITY_DN18722_c0_g1_i2:131-751(-)
MGDPYGNVMKGKLKLKKAPLPSIGLPGGAKKRKTTVTALDTNTIFHIMGDPYGNVMKGKLKLKKAPLPSIGLPGGAKKRKTPTKTTREVIEEEIHKEIDDEKKKSKATSAAAGDHNNDNGDRDDDDDDDDVETKRAKDSDDEDEDAARPTDTRTPAERRHEEARIKRELDLIKKNASKSHREKIEEFNQKLATMSEYHDIPKVGPG